ncbi:hypothetical protein CFOL_v3_00647 [Cephalotus follicularis]|uniref:UBN2 domain-containing protein n=1 Tax=Cephalotus follicularis TaxID=3775 RepID=A0A1Q3AMX8_CEPFO|nr:hypothetical protein CFOL_v3_00647 [Cephalotus follicularis]
MTIFIQALDFKLWNVIISGHDLLAITSNDGVRSFKPRQMFNNDDRRKFQLNAKTKHVIICALNSNKFNRISYCSTTKEMWDRLEVTYEGINLVNDAKINMLTRKYEMFSIVMHC